MHERDVLFLHLRFDCIQERVKLEPILKDTEKYERYKSSSFTVFFDNASLKYCAPLCLISLSLRLRDVSVCVK